MSPENTVPTGNTYDKYGSSNPVERRLMQGFLRRLDDAMPTSAPDVVIEVGAGEGVITERIARRYPSARIFGLDLPDTGLASEWRARALAGVFGDAAALPFPDACAGLVLAIEVLEHVGDPGAALAEMARICSGVLVVSVPHEPVWRLGNLLRGRYVTDLGNTPGHLNHWSKARFVDLVSRHAAVSRVVTPLPWILVSARPSSR